ncbi:zinc-finger domain protein [Sulfolobus virus Kamchatka 1]|uniref:ORF B158 n=1 Tax=Sulfolobus virus Kamchatka 1 TaxID=248496 RepID=Q6TDL4_9VIRU|nr:zinc-finger domain protein [Sulfolobus virus Kamchatka 1]AAQ94384.1 ORF B158 [Sulfolobus virus Kamchatka 1]
MGFQLRKTSYRRKKLSLMSSVLSARFTTTVGGIGMESGNKNYLSNHKTLGIHVTLEELKRYHSLTPEQKRLIRTIVKTLIYRPDLLENAQYLIKLAESKAVSPYVCPLCLMPFSSSVSLKQHIRYKEHAKTCPVCGKKFRNTDSTIDHVCKKHNICVS